MEKRHFYEKENAATKLLLDGMEGCAIFYVDTANNAVLLHVLAYHLRMQISTAHLVSCEAGALEGVSTRGSSCLLSLPGAGKKGQMQVCKGQLA